MAYEPGPLPLFRMAIEVTWPQLCCFGCTKIFEPPDIAISTEQRDRLHFPRSFAFSGEPLTRPLPPPPPPLSLVWSESAYAYSLIGAETEAKALETAEALGWRKVTIYGRTIYVCPECRKKHTRPEWEQRLTEPVLLGALVLKPPPDKKEDPAA